MKITIPKAKFFFEEKAPIDATDDFPGSEGVTAEQVGKVEFTAIVSSRYGESVGPFELVMPNELFSDEEARDALIFAQPGVEELVIEEADKDAEVAEAVRVMTEAAEENQRLEREAEEDAAAERIAALALQKINRSLNNGN